MINRFSYFFVKFLHTIFTLLVFVVQNISCFHKTHFYLLQNYDFLIITVHRTVTTVTQQWACQNFMKTLKKVVENVFMPIKK